MRFCDNLLSMVTSLINGSAAGGDLRKYIHANDYSVKNPEFMRLIISAMVNYFSKEWKIPETTETSSF